jgi:methionine synthase II (cobalamin-independent)
MATKKSDPGPTPAELSDALRDCADVLLDAYTKLIDQGEVRHARVIQHVEPSVRAAADALSAHADEVGAALALVSPHAKADD